MCPRCQGRLYSSLDGPTCLSCGFIAYKDPPLPYLGYNAERGSIGIPRIRRKSGSHPAIGEGRAGTIGHREG